jgi:hypothetical protein
LVRHKHAPSLGTEICVVPDETAIAPHQESALTILETVEILKLTVADLSWIHPEYASTVMDR